MKKYIYTLLVICLALCLSCGEKDDGKVSLSFMHFWTSDDVRPVIVSLVAEFEAQNPNITIELLDLNWSGGHDKITIGFATETAADIIELGSDWVPEYGAIGKLMDLSTESAAHQDSLRGWEAAVVGGKVYGFPWMLGTRVIFYNKNLMSQVGLDPQYPPKNWDELYIYSEAINEIGEPVYGFGTNAYEKFRLYKKFLPFLWSNGGEVLSENGKCMLKSGRALRALTYYTVLSDIGYMESQRNLDDKFMAGELGFIISGDWMLRKMKSSPPKFQVGACLIPGPKSSPESVSFLGGEFLTINANSEHKAEALKFIKFLVSKEPDLRFNRAAGSITPSNIMASREIMRDANPLAMTFLQQINYARPSPVHPKWVVMQDVIEDAVQKAIYHKGDVEEILREACDQIDRILNE
jgi:multiple sugar transport system substrate-binding protein